MIYIHQKIASLNNQVSNIFSLSVAGVTSLLASTTNVATAYFAKNNKKALSRGTNLFNGVLSVFGLIWLIVGSSYVYPLWEPNYRLCAKTPYMFSFVTITLAWVMALLGIIGGILACCCGCFGFKGRGSESYA